VIAASQGQRETRLRDRRQQSILKGHPSLAGMKLYWHPFALFMVSFEELDFTLMLFSCGTGLERTEVASRSGHRVLVAGVDPALPVLQLSDHNFTGIEVPELPVCLHDH
jgi:hypothetical protein